MVEFHIGKLRLQNFPVTKDMKVGMKLCWYKLEIDIHLSKSTTDFIIVDSPKLTLSWLINFISHHYSLVWVFLLSGFEFVVAVLQFAQ